MKKVFLGGTCNDSTWREDIIKKLKISYFNPVVDNWTEDCMKIERQQRELCDFVLYTITPRMTGVYSIAEVVEDSIKRPERTVLCVLTDDVDDKGNKISFDDGQLKSLNQVGEMVVRNGGKYFKTIDLAASYLNK